MNFVDGSDNNVAYFCSQIGDRLYTLNFSGSALAGLTLHWAPDEKLRIHSVSWTGTLEAGAYLQYRLLVNGGLQGVLAAFGRTNTDGVATIQENGFERLKIDVPANQILTFSHFCTNAMWVSFLVETGDAPSHGEKACSLLDWLRGECHGIA